MDGREVEMESSAMGFVEILPFGGPVGVQVIPDHMDGFVGVFLGDLFHEVEQIGLGAPIPALRKDFAGMHIQRSYQRLGAMPLVFKLLAANFSRPGWAVQVFPLNRLNSRLFINGKNDRPLGRPPIEIANDIDFFPESRVRTVQPLSNAMRPNVSRNQDSLNSGPTDFLNHASFKRAFNQFIQGRGRPAIPFMGLAGQSNDLKAFAFGNFSRTARTLPFFQPVQTLKCRTLAPFAHPMLGNPELRCDGAGWHALIGQQRNFGSQHIPLGSRWFLSQRKELLTLFVGKFHVVCRAPFIHNP